MQVLEEVLVLFRAVFYKIWECPVFGSSRLGPLLVVVGFMIPFGVWVIKRLLD